MNAYSTDYFKLTIDHCVRRTLDLARKDPLAVAVAMMADTTAAITCPRLHDSVM